MNNEQTPSWHEGELTIQKRVGTAERMAQIGPKFIREFMPEQHREYFQNLCMLFIGFTDHYSQPRASVLFGDPGFIESPTETTLVINTQNSMGDFIHQQLKVGDKIGLVGVEFDTKRRNRLNAIVTDISQKNITINVLQSFGNCPKYIQDKTFKTHHAYGAFSTSTRSALDATDKQLIVQADTFFIASSFDDGEALRNRGVDMSHRGGEAGFVKMNAKEQLLVEDYYGNGFFNTMGNLLHNPIASLLFFDWQNGHILQLTVSSEILWDDKEQTDPTENTKAERTLRFTPLKVDFINNGLAYLQT
ncbi:pyridoxamine 5'-phosphate oxidase family protein [Psychromonas algicola]|uniref:pyridoxamine 5'-phosphate oxidase family protein n=1 Tax=Psychromonas algicola TaxID=2555642 RepID=UPI00106816F0|nr:pyridoxamine 5'-phosphate oxidase family protein [Psychromonas sp. RZ5]TEW52655.1 pyridoxamine 5'-phosphate oxidase family protein [Psychromonas sp. RZ5]